ncbi:MAG: hypothetical protein JSV12_01615 [Candidatus Bathyarchaeota archaeon]|nr:MAG: hypothetical protein JSV12_01615 [Candidatus Bathyarchaeota archaeon]
MTLKKLYPFAIAISTIALTILTITTTGLLSVNKTLSSTGSVTAINVGVYSDIACTNELTTLEWGTISPGNSENITIYLKNTGNSQITLSMTRTNWTPVNANGPITLSWDKENADLNPNQETATTLTLSISESIDGITDFSFDVVITGTE